MEGMIKSVRRRKRDGVTVNSKSCEGDLNCRAVGTWEGCCYDGICTSDEAQISSLREWVRLPSGHGLLG